MITLIKTILIIAVVLATLYVLSTAGRTGHPGLEGLRGWKYAHRGLHDKDKPENSMAAFRNAVAHGFGMELDVQLTADGQLVVEGVKKIENSPIRYGFGDYNLSWLFTPTSKDKIWLEGYFGQDNALITTGGFDVNLGVTWTNYTGAIHWEHLAPNAPQHHTIFISGYDSDGAESCMA